MKKLIIPKYLINKAKTVMVYANVGKAISYNLFEVSMIRMDFLRPNLLALFIVFAFSLQLSASSSGAEMGITEEDGGIVIESDYARFIVSRNGEIAAFQDKRTGVDYLDHSVPVSFMSVWRGTVEYGSSSVGRKGNVLKVEFEGSGLTAEVEAAAYPGYFTLEVKSINQNTLDELAFINLPLTIAERVGNVINICRNAEFGVCLMSVNVQTESRMVRERPAAFRASCYPRYGIEGSRAAIMAGPADSMLAIIGGMELDQGLPHPMLAGEWGKVSREARKSYLFVDYTEANIDTAIRYAKEGGFEYLLNYDNVWASTRGHYEVNKRNFPNGLDGLKSVMDKIHAAGLKCGAHILSGCISKNDGYVTPLPDPRLAKDDMRILDAGISAGDTVIPLTASPEGLPLKENYLEGGMDMVIDGEIISYRGYTKDPPYALTGCVRGAYGTRASPHARGARAYHLTQLFRMFLVDGNTSMLQEVAQRVADIINYCGFDMIYFDGAEAMEKNGSFWYYTGKMLAETFSRFRREVIAQGSSMPHFNWHNYSRRYTSDYAMLDPKGMVDYHCTWFEEAVNNFMPGELGWHGLLLDGLSSESTLPDDIEYLLAKSIGWDFAWSLETQMRTMSRHGRLSEILALSNIYEKLRLEGYFPASVREALRTPGQDFKLLRDRAGAWQLHPVSYGPARLVSCGAGWTAENRYGGQPLKVRIKARPAVARSQDPVNILLADFAAPEKWRQSSAVPDFRLEMEKTEQGVRLSSRNESSQRSSWTSRTLTLEPPLDLSSHRALGFMVNGDNSGALLNVQIRDDSEVAGRNYFVRLNFSGPRLIEMPEPSTMEAYKYSWPHWPLLAVGNINYRKIKFISVYLNDVPPKTGVACVLGPVEALRETPSTILNPSLTVNGQTVTFPATLRENEYLEFWGEKATAYDKDGHRTAEFVPEGVIPELRNGRNEIVLNGESPAGSGSVARVEIITIGDPVK